SSDFAFEDLAKAALDGARPVVMPVASSVAPIGLGQGIENGRRHRRGIVTGKIHSGTRQMVCLADRRMAPQPQFGPLACDSSDTGGFAAARSHRPRDAPPCRSNDSASEITEQAVP